MPAGEKNDWKPCIRHLQKCAKEDHGEIHWSDETAIMNADGCGRSYAPSRQVSVDQDSSAFSMNLSVDNQMECCWMIVTETFIANGLIECMGSIEKDVERKIFPVMDNLKVHHSKPINEWFATHERSRTSVYAKSQARDNDDCSKACAKKARKEKGTSGYGESSARWIKSVFQRQACSPYRRINGTYCRSNIALFSSRLAPDRHPI